MQINKMLASITADTSLIEEKLNRLLEMLPEHIPDEFLSMFSGLADDVVLVDSPSTISTGCSFNIVCALDFDSAAYNKVMAAARTLKTDISAH